MHISVAYKGGFFVLFSFSPQIYPPPSLPRNYRPVHYFRPVVIDGNENRHLQKALEESTGKLESDPAHQSRHALTAAQRREQLGEAELKGIEIGDHTFACVSSMFVSLFILGLALSTYFLTYQI